jgi:hypothetical protein
MFRWFIVAAMKSEKQSFLLSGRLPTAVLICAALATPVAQASTLWTGPNIIYSQVGPASAGQEYTGTPDVLIPGAVSIARNGNGPLYNPAAGETASNFSTSPADTMWAFQPAGTSFPTTLPSPSSFVTFASLRNGALSSVILNKPMVVHLVSQDIYLFIEFSDWNHQFTGGSFTYTRSTPGAVVTPTVSITAPTNGSVFIAPASIGLTANASATGGTVTNVQYFAGSTSLGSAGTSPFGITGHISAPGTYALTAVATAAGISATSSVVNITVVGAPTVNITNPLPNAVFAAPANVQIDANAGGGTVTNVTFFNGSTPLGSVLSAPFSITASNLVAGSYPLTAVATAGGLSATSTVVNVSVVTPISVTASSPQAGNGQFTFSYSADPGLTYVVFRSHDLATWTAVATNKAASNPVAFSDPVSANSASYYRVARLPNP